MASDERADAPERVPDDRLDELMKGIGRGFTSDEARDLERVVAGYRELRDLPPGELLNRTARVEARTDEPCPDCDGTGQVAGHYTPRTYVSHEMASDAGCPEMEGSVYSEESIEAEPCARCEGTGRVAGEPPVDEEVEAQLLRIERLRADAEHKLTLGLDYGFVTPTAMLELCELAAEAAQARAVRTNEATRGGE